VRRIFRDACDGQTPGRIARNLNRDEVAAPQGGSQGWSPAGVRLILRNAVYAGERYGVKRAHPAIVSRQVFNAAQRGLEQRRRARPA
jgi:hypothetical protein